MSEIYRDRTEGATAKRQELLRRRRDELVTMPHAVRRVVVARSARVAAGLAVMLAGTALLGTASSPAAAVWLAHGLPGIQPAALATLLGATWIVGLCVYAISRARVEHRFAVAMSRYVLPGDDLDHDIERLDHEHPDEAAKQMANALEVRSIVFPVIAAAFVLPATAIYIVHAIKTRGWPAMAEFELSLTTHAHGLVAIACCGAIAGVVMTRRAARLPIVAPIAIPLAIAAGVFAAASDDATGAWSGLGVAMIAGTIGVLVRRLRIERAMIATDDPAAGSELFTLHGLVATMRAAIVAVRHAITRDNLRRLAHRRSMQVLASSVVIVGTAGYFYEHRTRPAHAATVAGHLAHAPVAVPAKVFDHPDGFAVTRTNDGRFRLDLELQGDTPYVVPSLAELETLPKGWSASVMIEVGDRPPGPLTIAALDLPPRVLEINSKTELATNLCDDHLQSLAFSVYAAPGTVGPHHVTLFLAPRLGVAQCPPPRLGVTFSDQSQ